MQTVWFIDSETGDDLIVSFAIPTDPASDDIVSLILLRTPKYETFFEDAERGVKVLPENDDEHELLIEVNFDKASGVVTLTTASRRYELDVHKVDPDELGNMCQVLHKMNFDHRLKLSGV